MRWLRALVLVDAGPIMVTRFASGIFFGGILVSLVLTMARILPERLQATGQTLLQATGFGVAAILANLLGGLLYAAAGPLGVFGVGAACAVIGGLIGLAVLPQDERAPRSNPAESVPGAAWTAISGIDGSRRRPRPGTMPATARRGGPDAALGRSIRRHD